jgi:flagellar biosynthetic protein FliQ
MTPESIADLLRQTLEVALLLSGPLLIAALAAGLLVSILQAATQVNEITLPFVPKLVAVLAVLTLAGPWMLNVVLEFTRRLFANIPGMLG